MFAPVINYRKSIVTVNFVLIACCSLSPSINAEELTDITVFKSKIEYQHAAQFSSLSWHDSIEPAVKVKLKPLKNYSGIASNAVQHKPEYYDHGKLPQTINHLLADLVFSSRYLEVDKSMADVEIQINLNQYSHPFNYAPDDHWYESLQDQVDRWALTPKHAKVGLTLKMTSKSNRFKPWMSSVASTLSNCDLNGNNHSLMPFNHADKSLLAYSESTMGQAFIAAGNYLLLQAIEHLNTQQKRAQVLMSSDNEILLSSAHSRFVTGEKYQLRFNHSYPSPLQQSAGSVQVVKSMGNQAIAYPIDLRPDHIKVGDWVEIGKPQALLRPSSNYIAKNQCASVGTAKVTTAKPDEV